MGQNCLFVMMTVMMRKGLGDLMLMVMELGEGNTCRRKMKRMNIAMFFWQAYVSHKRTSSTSNCQCRGNRGRACIVHSKMMTLRVSAPWKQQQQVHSHLE